MSEAREATVDPGLLKRAYERMQRFIEFDTNGGCWLWSGALGGGRYGVVHIRPHVTAFSAHRLAYWIERGPIPGGLQANHKCDVRECCNPEHIFVGTQADNLQDASRKGRLHLQHYNVERRGERHPRARFSNEDVRAMRALADAGFSTAYVARLFGASDGHAFKIVGGRARRGG